MDIKTTVRSRQAIPMPTPAKFCSQMKHSTCLKGKNKTMIKSKTWLKIRQFLISRLHCIQKICVENYLSGKIFLNSCENVEFFMSPSKPQTRSLFFPTLTKAIKIYLIIKYYLATLNFSKIIFLKFLPYLFHKLDEWPICPLFCNLEAQIV